MSVLERRTSNTTSSAAVVMMSVRVMRLMLLQAVPHRIVPVIVTVGAGLESARCQAFLRSTRHILASRAEVLELSNSNGGNSHGNTCCNLCSLSRSGVFGLDEKRLAGSEQDDQQQSHGQVIANFESQGTVSSSQHGKTSGAVAPFPWVTYTVL